MKPPQAPRLDQRRAAQFAAELQERARAWIPALGLADGEQDFGRALLKIAARFDSEVAERLDGSGEKMRRGFLDWLAVRGQAARPARMPVVFKLTDAAREAVRAAAPVRLQADAVVTAVVFETEEDVRVVPGQLDMVVGVDADQDAFYFPPPGLSDLQPLESLPTEWRVKSFAASGSMKLQLDPELGLIVGMLIEANGAQYTVREVDNGLVTIDRPVESELTSAVRITQVTTFTPFEGTAYNSQQHSLYLGDSELLNIEAAATIEVVGASTLREGYAWQYWGKVNGQDEVKWQPLTLDKEKQKTIKDAIVLTKLKGAIEEFEIGGKKSRWIRAYRKTVDASEKPFAIDQISLRINSSGCGPVPCPPSAEVESPEADALANTTPLVLSEPFYPLGREPRQFDAFYLGCEEAFSKKEATAHVCFEISDATSQTYAVVRSGASTNKVLAGVGKDRALHLFRFNAGVLTKFRGPLRPPRPLEPGAQVEQATSLELNLRCRPVIWGGDPTTKPDDFYVAVAAGGGIWVWHENADPKQSGWNLHSTVPALPNTPAEIEDIIVLGSSPDRPGAVLSSGRFWMFDAVNNNWFQPVQPLPQPPNTPLRDYTALAPIYDANGALTDSMVAVSAVGDLYRLEIDATESDPTTGFTVDFVPPGRDLPMGIRPAAIDDGRLKVVAVSNGRKDLVAVEFSGGAWQTPQVVSLPLGTEAIGVEVTIASIAGTIDGIANPTRQFSVGAKTAAGGAFVASWIPTFVATDPTTLLESTIPDALGPIGGTPVVAGKYIVVPGGRSDAFVAPFDPSARLEFSTKVLVEGVILPAPTATFAINDFISVMPANVTKLRMEWKVTTAPSTRASEVIYIVDPALGESVADDPKLLGYLAAGSLAGTISDSKHFDPTVADPAIVPGMILRITVGLQPAVFCEVASVHPVTHEVEVKTTTQLPANTGNLSYWKPNTSVARVVPAIEFQPAGDGNWDASILDTANLFFPVAPSALPVEPSPQRATAFGIIGTHPTVVALTKRWTSPPLNAPTPFIIDGVIGTWRHQLSDTTSNPALSWEYWNGKGWWSLEIINDGTERLAATGAVNFIVPKDIAESDWAGRTNFWIRARLVGGDYGHEEVKVITKPGANAGETEQTVERSTENIRAPQILNLSISYAICNEVYPTFLQAEDSGTIRDQSDANSTAGAIVEAFVPLSITLGRLSRGGVASETPADCPPECACDKQQSSSAVTPAIAATAPAATSTRETGRSVFIGLNATLSETPVNVLLLVDEQNHTAFAPMTIDALVADHFVPIVADDTTRALGESGLLSMSFAIPPTPSELFGQTLTWLRLKPKASTDGKWLPTLRGAYLNAAWASATETLTRELLGSSNGEPHLTVRLARPPLLYKTLELRVKEPLGEEERNALLKTDKNSVLSTVEGLEGDWVLWKEVIDPDDEPAAARVYSLDEETGEIRFGDGIHGKIPPIGRDTIVAFRYCRTEPDPTGGDKVPGNTIKARATLNLVSPVETVESVIAAGQAAGGAPPESDERVLRFGFARLRHRDRAVTANDIEDLALQSSPDIVQAHAFVHRGYVRLVVVMRGKNPKPNAAQIRELRRLLLAAAPISLSAPGALRIEGPVIRRLRIELELRVETLDHAGELTDFIKLQLATFFDTATGGADKDGWELGLNPTEGDLALALIDAPYLESIIDVKLREITDDGRTAPSLETLKANELVILADDPIRIQFETAEVSV